ncbi:MAG TPA: STAS/SEC14 domain-containing protein [Lysobacter sp.]|nr:STAS/SEC14 domain-containing protein [Lysobacter sp.]
MHRITRLSPLRLDIDVQGRLDADAMHALIDDLLRESEGFDHGRLLCRVRDFEWPSPGALGVELSRMPELFAMIGRFGRVALLVDETWIQRLGRLEGALVPGLEVRGFALDEAAAAEAWLAG